MKDSLKVEQSQFEKQDRIYRHLFGHEPHRLDYDKYTDAQRDDIDLVIKNNSGRPLKISEKYRPFDYGDVLFEVWSVFPNDKGWGCESKADIMTYWTPTKLTIIDIRKTVEIFERNEISKQMHLIEDSKELCSFILNHKTYYFWVVRAINQTYSSLSVALKYEHLDKLGIKYSVIPLG